MSLWTRKEPLTNFRCLRSCCPGRKKTRQKGRKSTRRMKKIQEKDQDPRKDPSTQMCSRSRQKLILPDTRCLRIPRRLKKIQEQISPAEIPSNSSTLVCRQVSRDPHVDRAIITSNSEAILSETWANRYPPRTWMWRRSWVPSRSSDHPSPGPQCRLILRCLLRREECYAAESRPAIPR